MSERYIKVDTVETVDSSTSTALVALIVTIIAALIIGLAVWQPWAASVTAPVNSTTVIHDKETKVQPSNSSTPIIIQQPASKPADTNVTIHNDVSKDSDSKSKADDGQQTNSGIDTNNDASNSN